MAIIIWNASAKIHLNACRHINTLFAHSIANKMCSIRLDVMRCDAMERIMITDYFFILSAVSLCPESLSINFKRHSYIFQLISYVTFVRIYCRNLYVCQLSGIIPF